MERVLGPYQLEAELGRGGMGVVYRALDPRLGRQVAIKLITDPGPEPRARFEIEAEAGGRLRHRNLVGVHDLGYADGFLYLVSEFVAGEALDSVVKRQGKLDPAQAASLVERLAEGLAHAHAEGVLHRDIKPANVIVDESGEPRLTDFGVARIGSGAMTHTGELLGTVDYMSPEQASGEWGQVDGRADVYSLGATLYELLTGQPPFRAATVVATLAALMTEAIVPPGQLADLPPGLSAIVEKSLAKEPGQRYPSSAAFGAALAAWREALAAAPLRERQGRASVRIAIGGVACTALVGLGYVGATRFTPGPGPSARSSAPEPSARSSAPVDSLGAGEGKFARGELLWRGQPPQVLAPLEALKAYSQAAPHEPAAYAGIAEILDAGHGSAAERAKAVAVLEAGVAAAGAAGGVAANEAEAALALWVKGEGDAARLEPLARALWARGDSRGLILLARLQAERGETIRAVSTYREADTNPRARAALGLLLIKEKRVGEGYRELEIAGQADCAEALLGLADCYRLGAGIEADKTRARKFYARAAAAGSAEAMNWLYFVSKDEKASAREWLTKAARLGDPRACWRLGTTLMKEGHEEEAYAWVRFASLRGYHFATSQLGTWVSEGQGVRQDFERALEVWRWGAAGGSVPCVRELSEALTSRGRIGEAREALGPLAEEGSPLVLTLLGESYLQREPKDLPRGVAALERAAGQEFRRAILTLAKHFREEGNLEGELRYSEQAAGLGHAGYKERAALLRKQLGR